MNHDAAFSTANSVNSANKPVQHGSQPFALFALRCERCERCEQGRMRFARVFAPVRTRHVKCERLKPLPDKDVRSVRTCSHQKHGGRYAH